MERTTPISASAQKAVEAADERMRNFVPNQRWDTGGRREKTEAVVRVLIERLIDRAKTHGDSGAVELMYTIEAELGGANE